MPQFLSPFVADLLLASTPMPLGVTPGVAAAAPQLHSTCGNAKFGQQIIERLAQRSTPDGSCLVASATHWSRRSDEILAGIPDALERIVGLLVGTRQTSQIGRRSSRICQLPVVVHGLVHENATCLLRRDCE